MTAWGRYASHYGQLQVVHAQKPENLASGSSRKARVRCWTYSKDRFWGKDGNEHAAVMHFQMQAQGLNDCKLSEFELDLIFSMPQGAEELQNGNVYIAWPPAPSRIGEMSGVSVQSWKLRSELLDEHENANGSTARWTFKAKGEDMRADGKIIYGGLVLRHCGQPFMITCRVRGKVAEERGGRSKFSNYNHAPKVWQLIPRSSDEDLQLLIEELEAKMRLLNQPDSYRGSRSQSQISDLHERDNTSDTDADDRARGARYSSGRDNMSRNQFRFGAHSTVYLGGGTPSNSG